MKAIKYAVNWDNGAEACGTFPYRFETEAEAESFGERWVAEMRQLDPDANEDEDGGYTYEVIELEEDDAGPDPESLPDNPRPQWA